MEPSDHKDWPKDLVSRCLVSALMSDMSVLVIVLSSLIVSIRTWQSRWFWLL